MRDPYRVAIWGLGSLGEALVRQIDRLDSVSLVGALAYSETKMGTTVGQCIGLEHLDQPVVGSLEDLVALDPEVVLYVTLDTMGGNDEDLLALLGRGINVITALPYRHLDLDDAAREPFDQACANGSTFHVAGVNPDFTWDRFIPTLSGLCTEIDSITVTEIWNAETLGEEMYKGAGFGQPYGDSGIAEMFQAYAGRYFVPSMSLAAARLGRPLDRVESSYQYDPIPQDITLRGELLEEGTLGRITFRWDGYIDDQQFTTYEGIYYCGVDLRPDFAPVDDCWIVEIEGRPSIRNVVETYASLADGSNFYPGEQTQAGYYATAAPMITAIRRVVDADQGVLSSAAPALHYRHDLRA